VRAFGEKVFDIIQTTPDRLREIDGIGPIRAASILSAWAEVRTARAVQILKTYGSDAIQVMSGNPYRLAATFAALALRLPTQSQ
jgi:exodeoxyribonuclease V alpha subunit